MENVHKAQVRKVKIQDYEINQTIGMGTYSRVRLGKHKSQGRFFAIKVFKKCEIINNKQLEHIINEVKILTFIKHPYIISIDGVGQDEKFLYVIIEYVNGGDFFSFLRQNGKIAFDQVQFYTAQIVLMLEYLHSKEIAYRDLKPENLLFDNKGFLKLTDFGFAKAIDDKTYTICGTPNYMAPEILLNEGHNKCVDFWSLGVIIYEMLAGIDPFNDEDPMKIYQKITHSIVKFPSKFDKSAKSLVKKLLVRDVAKRLGNLKNGVNDIKSHRFFKDIEFTLINKFKPNYVPRVSGNGDFSNFPVYDDSDDNLTPTIPPDKDPFADWVAT